MDTRSRLRYILVSFDAFFNLFFGRNDEAGGYHFFYLVCFRIMKLSGYLFSLLCLAPLLLLCFIRDIRVSFF